MEVDLRIFTRDPAEARRFRDRSREFSKAVVQQFHVSGQPPPVEPAPETTTDISPTPTHRRTRSKSPAASRAWHGHTGPRVTSAPRRRPETHSNGRTVTIAPTLDTSKLDPTRPATTTGFVRKSNPKNSLRLLSAASDMAAAIEASQRAMRLASYVRDMEEKEQLGFMNPKDAYALDYQPTGMIDAAAQQQQFLHSVPVQSLDQQAQQHPSWHSNATPHKSTRHVHVPIAGSDPSLHVGARSPQTHVHTHTHALQHHPAAPQLSHPHPSPMLHHGAQHHILPATRAATSFHVHGHGHHGHTHGQHGHVTPSSPQISARQAEASNYQPQSLMGSLLFAHAAPVHTHEEYLHLQHLQHHPYSAQASPNTTSTTATVTPSVMALVGPDAAGSAVTTPLQPPQQPTLIMDQPASFFMNPNHPHASALRSAESPRLLDRRSTRSRLSTHSSAPHPTTATTPASFTPTRPQQPQQQPQPSHRGSSNSFQTPSQTPYQFAPPASPVSSRVRTIAVSMQQQQQPPRAAVVAGSSTAPVSGRQQSVVKPPMQPFTPATTAEQVAAVTAAAAVAVPAPSSRPSTAARLTPQHIVVPTTATGASASEITASIFGPSSNTVAKSNRPLSSSSPLVAPLGLSTSRGASPVTSPITVVTASVYTPPAPQDEYDLVMAYAYPTVPSTTTAVADAATAVPVEVDSHRSARSKPRVEASAAESSHPSATATKRTHESDQHESTMHTPASPQLTSTEPRPSGSVSQVRPRSVDVSVKKSAAAASGIPAHPPAVASPAVSLATSSSPTVSPIISAVTKTVISSKRELATPSPLERREFEPTPVAASASNAANEASELGATTVASSSRASSPYGVVLSTPPSSDDDDDSSDDSSTDSSDHDEPIAGERKTEGEVPLESGAITPHEVGQTPPTEAEEEAQPQEFPDEIPVADEVGAELTQSEAATAGATTAAVALESEQQLSHSDGDVVSPELLTPILTRLDSVTKSDGTIAIAGPRPVPAGKPGLAKSLSVDRRGAGGVPVSTGRRQSFTRSNSIGAKEMAAPDSAGNSRRNSLTGSRRGSAKRRPATAGSDGGAATGSMERDVDGDSSRSQSISTPSVDINSAVANAFSERSATAASGTYLGSTSNQQGRPSTASGETAIRVQFALTPSARAQALEKERKLKAEKALTRAKLDASLSNAVARKPSLTTQTVGQLHKGKALSPSPRLRAQEATAAHVTQPSPSSATTAGNQKATADATATTTFPVKHASVSSVAGTDGGAGGGGQGSAPSSRGASPSNFDPYADSPTGSPAGPRPMSSLDIASRERSNSSEQRSSSRLGGLSGGRLSRLHTNRQSGGGTEPPTPTNGPMQGRRRMTNEQRSTRLSDAEDAMRKDLRSSLTMGSPLDPFNFGQQSNNNTNGAMPEIDLAQQSLSSPRRPSTRLSSSYGDYDAPPITSAQILAEEQAKARAAAAASGAPNVSRRVSVLQMKLKNAPKSRQSIKDSLLKDSSAHAAPIPLTVEEIQAQEMSILAERAERRKKRFTDGGNDVVAEEEYDDEEEGTHPHTELSFYRGQNGQTPRGVGAMSNIGFGVPASGISGEGVSSPRHYYIQPLPSKKIDLDTSLTKGVGFEGGRDRSDSMREREGSFFGGSPSSSGYGMASPSNRREFAPNPMLNQRSGWNYGYKNMDDRWVQRIKNEIVPEPVNPYKNRPPQQTLHDFLAALRKSDAPTAWKYESYKKTANANVVKAVSYDEDIDENGVENPKRARYRDLLRRAQEESERTGLPPSIPSYEDFESESYILENQTRRFLHFYAPEVEDDDENKGEVVRFPFPTARLLYLPLCDLPADQCQDVNCRHYEERMLAEENARKYAIKQEKLLMQKRKEEESKRREKELAEWLAMSENEKEIVLMQKEKQLQEEEKVKAMATEKEEKERAREAAKMAGVTPPAAGTGRETRSSSVFTFPVSPAAPSGARPAAGANSTMSSPIGSPVAGPQASPTSPPGPQPLSLSELILQQPERFTKNRLRSPTASPLDEKRSPLLLPLDSPSVIPQLPLLTLVSDYHASPVALQGKKLPTMGQTVQRTMLLQKMRNLGQHAKNKLSAVKTGEAPDAFSSNSDGSGPTSPMSPSIPAPSPISSISTPVTTHLSLLLDGYRSNAASPLPPVVSSPVMSPRLATPTARRLQPSQLPLAETPKVKPTEESVILTPRSMRPQSSNKRPLQHSKLETLEMLERAEEEEANR